MEKNITLYDAQYCAWCGDDIITEVYSETTERNYCRTKCMVSHIKVESNIENALKDQ